MDREIVLTDALLVLPGAVVAGTLVVRDGRIAEIQPGRSALPGAVSLGGDHLLPGLVDLHTDNLERQVEPRPGARWPSRSAMIAHDGQTAAAGVTTVLDALCVGDLDSGGSRDRTFRDGVRDLAALAGSGALRCEHFLHLRCELPVPGMPDMFEAVAEDPLVRMVSLMDHSPGVGQNFDLERYRRRLRREGVGEAELERHLLDSAALRARNSEASRAAVLARMAGRGVALAAHDDWDAGEVARNAADGIGVSEFPVNVAAAAAARAAGMGIIAGAPNIVRGGSHNGNVSAMALLRDGMVDAIASDYVPAAMLEAAWRAGAEGGIGLAAAVRTVTDAPARMAGLADRGRLEPGLRADLVRVRPLAETADMVAGAPHGDGQAGFALPVVRAAWLAGERVA